MIVHVAGMVEGVAEQLLISVGEAEAKLLPERPGVRYVVDSFADAGPLAGLHAGLAAAATPWILAVACDLPFLTEESLRTLLASRTRQAHAVVARSPDGRLHPLCACYHRRALPAVTAHLAAGRYALYALLEALPNVRVVDLPAGPLRNVNTPADLL